MPDILVATQPDYCVRVEPDLGRFSLTAAKLGNKVALVTDANVGALYADKIANALDREVILITIPAGEAHKSPADYVNVLNRMAEGGMSRKDSVLALGGGVVGDLAGFAAATYMRGVSYVQVPTSLLAMVDSSVGGKTAINIDYGKNLCGAFYQPAEVYCDLEFLDTLPAREIACGWGEIIKYAFLSDTVTPDDLMGDVTPLLVAKCVRIKADVVAADEREAGLRKLLNLGHTVGHAVERLSGFALSHGECVVKGLDAVLEMSHRYYDMSAETYATARSILSAKGHDLTIPYAKEDVLREIFVDKKSDADGCDMVLIDDDMKARVVRLGYEQIRELL